MNRIDALKELLAKVEAGTLRDEPYGGMPMLTQFHDGMKPHSISGFSDGFAMGAYDGSLDAAKALHEAVLPGWVAKPEIGGQGCGRKLWHCVLEDWITGDEETGGPCGNPARAWLIAILKALIAEANGREGGE